MAIRIRIIDGHMVALCAARTKPQKGDIYLDDNVHHALSSKFAMDFYEEGFLKINLAEKNLLQIMKKTEIS